MVGVNLFGFVVRGFFWAAPRVNAPTDRVAQLLNRESRRTGAVNRMMTAFGALAIAAGLFALFWFSGVRLAVATTLIMVSRLPDLLWEIRTGNRVTRHNAPGGSLHTLATVVLVSTLPLVWYSLCKPQ